MGLLCLGRRVNTDEVQDLSFHAIILLASCSSLWVARFHFEKWPLKLGLLPLDCMIT